MSIFLVTVSMVASFGKVEGVILALIGICFGMIAWLVRMQCDIHDLEDELNYIHNHVVESTEILEQILAEVTQGVKEQNETPPTSP